MPKRTMASRRIYILSCYVVVFKTTLNTGAFNDGLVMIPSAWTPQSRQSLRSCGGVQDEKKV